MTDQLPLFDSITDPTAQEERQRVAREWLLDDSGSKRYQIIYADPPWAYKDPQDADPSRRIGAAGHYPVMDPEELKMLNVGSIADKNCALFMWVTMPLLQEGLDLVKAWGFEYKTCAFTWVKRNRVVDGYFMGMGNWTRSNAELCLLAVCGSPQRINKGVRQIVDARIQKLHSQKPDEVRDRIVQLMGDIPRIELFARTKTDGWDVWGNEVESDISLTSETLPFSPPSQKVPEKLAERW